LISCVDEIVFLTATGRSVVAYCFLVDHPGIMYSVIGKVRIVGKSSDPVNESTNLVILREG